MAGSAVFERILWRSVQFPSDRGACNCSEGLKKYRPKIISANPVLIIIISFVTKLVARYYYICPEYKKFNSSHLQPINLIDGVIT